MVLVLFTYASYASLMLYNTPDLTSTAWLDNGKLLVLASLPVLARRLGWLFMIGRTTLTSCSYELLQMAIRRQPRVRFGEDSEGLVKRRETSASREPL